MANASGIQGAIKNPPKQGPEGQRASEEQNEENRMLPCHPEDSVSHAHEVPEGAGVRPAGEEFLAGGSDWNRTARNHGTKKAQNGAAFMPTEGLKNSQVSLGFFVVDALGPGGHERGYGRFVQAHHGRPDRVQQPAPAKGAGQRGEGQGDFRRLDGNKERSKNVREAEALAPSSCGTADSLIVQC
jgi:hypothetical protein